MITLSKLRRKPRHFRAFTGLTPFEFDALLVELTPVYKAAFTQRSQTPDRSPEASLPLVPTRKKRITTLQELLLTYPEIAEVLLDATEQSVPQPEDKQQRKLAYSGKQHDHTILHVFGGLPGCLKKRGCMAGVWWGKFADHEGVFCVIAGLLNFRHTGKFELIG